MEHIEKNILEKYIMSREDITPGELDNITAHLEQCSYCKEHAEKLTAFYDSVSKEMQNNPIERDKAFADKLLTRNRFALPEKKLALQERVDNALSTFVEIIEPYHRPLAQRFIRYIQIHPLRVASGFSMAAALVFATLLIQPMFKDTNPSYARAKDEFLVVYNQSGEELWKKHIGPGYDSNLLTEHAARWGDYLVTMDVDGDEKKEVFAIFGLLGEKDRRSVVFCYGSDGSERWKYEFHRNMKFGDENFSDDYLVQALLVGDYDRDGRVEIIATAVDEIYYPTSIFRLDASTGSFISEYWHPGSVYPIAHWDIDEDGVEELLIPGCNNAYNMASLAVVDPRHLAGHAPATMLYVPAGIPSAAEKYYILFPRTDLKNLAPNKRNLAKWIHFTKERAVRIHVDEEFLGKAFYPIFYYLNSQFQCQRVDPFDQFITFHRKMEAEGKLTKKLDAQYYEDLRKSVQYWDGERFVNYPTMNKRYLSLKSQRSKIIAKPPDGYL